jgi:hypothetical protein
MAGHKKWLSLGDINNRMLYGVYRKKVKSQEQNAKKGVKICSTEGEMAMAYRICEGFT